MDVAGKYAGLTLGAIRRNSTARQVGNYRSAKQLETVEHHVERHGGRIVLYDEQGQSGRRLANRPVARGLLADLADGFVQGIAVDVLDRLTRDELGIDAGAIAQALIKVRGLLVTTERDYRLWQRSDLLIYRILSGLAGVEGLGIRDNNWDGLFRKAQGEPFFMGLPPFGYRTIVEETRAAAGGRASKVQRRPVRADELAPVFAALAQAFDECLTLGDVVARMNASGHYLSLTRGPAAGTATPWTNIRLRHILDNPLYVGQWVFGRHSDHSSPIWDAPSADGAARSAGVRLDVPALAWFTHTTMEGWREKLLPRAGRPTFRRRTWDRPLRGVMVCAGCGAVLVAAGAQGYRCPRTSNIRQGLGCPAPQTIRHVSALRMLRAEVPLLLAERADYRARLAARVAGDTDGDRREKLRDQLAAQLDAMAVQWYAPGAGLTVPDPIARRMSDLQREINQLGEALARERKTPALSAAEAAILANVELGMPTWWDGLTEEEVCRVIRRAMSDVRFESGGHASGRWWRIVSRTNRLLST